MVSRTPRKSASQPRPARSSSRGATFDTWENVNDNARPSMIPERRAKSSIRYQSSTRSGSRSRSRLETPKAHAPISSPNVRPRAVSASKIRSNTASAPQEILKPTKRKESPRHLRPQASRESPQGRVLKTAGSNMSQEEIHAETRLKKAESKISGLLEELEELQFFQELESEETPAAPKTPKTPSQDRGIPQSIRAASPSRGRLPPPPPATKQRSGGGLETYKPMSPRQIAKLDRNSLELECQTLVRKIQILDQERNSQAAMIDMYEVALQDQDRDKKKAKKVGRRVEESVWRVEDTTAQHPEGEGIHDERLRAEDPTESLKASSSSREA